MNTLTKILIVLLTLSSLFLCGYVVQYVASADAYKQDFDAEKNKNRSLENNLKTVEEQLENEKKNTAAHDDLNKQTINSLETKIIDLNGQIVSLRNDKDELDKKVQDYFTKVESANQMAQQQVKLFEDKQKEYTDTKNELTKRNKEYEDIANALLEKEVIVDNIEKQLKILEEQKQSLLKKLNGLLVPSGQKAITSQTITKDPGVVREFVPATSTAKLDINGLITTIDMKKSLAQVSVGAVDGVKRGMTFHISRGSEYICDIQIIDVNNESSIGMLELVVQQPQIGDKASTNL